MADAHTTELTRGEQMLVLATAFLGWLMAGTNMAIVPLAGRSVALSLGGQTGEGSVGWWFAAFTCAFLLGAAAGGLLFGALGDRIGRVKAMGHSILCYSLFSLAAYFVTSPEQFLVLRFLACLGVGGIWPNGVALASEAWANVSRAMLSGLIGTAANVGFMVLSLAAIVYPITVESWRWVMVFSATPALLGLFVLWAVPESRVWLAARSGSAKKDTAQGATVESAKPAVGEVFRPPLLKLTLLGILLGAIPLMGNWGSANWLVPWAGQVGEADGGASLKAWTQWSKSGGAAVGSLLGGWLACQFGRRAVYFLISLCSLAISSYIFWNLKPGDPHFLWWSAAIGFVGTVYFGWLPLYLPELYPTRVRATGTGVTFNFGRVATAAGVLAAGQLMAATGGDYARMGRITCLVYVLGLVIICFAPDTSKKRLDESG
ncbi:MAG: MFS transporter [Planctomycetaceae bacterium]